MNDIISDAEIRHEQKHHRLGGAKKCVCCGEDDPRCLELHHIAGRVHANELVCVCRNCHRKLSDAQRDQPVGFNWANPTMSSIGYFSLGLADLLELIVQKLREWGKLLIDWAQNYVMVEVEETAQ
ncbi:MAG: hypothetical protein CME88_16945 [Hirschia sp.]|nr:hypothetical protein [Hirschia sp.]MBF20064.1 hypothetical protein [Hirschia sp.]|tara:strand:- start:369 stop:743 length:375 start_codon:yes stop_codon:yes gene_type:complete